MTLSNDTKCFTMLRRVYKAWEVNDVLGNTELAAALLRVANRLANRYIELGDEDGSFRKMFG